MNTVKDPPGKETLSTLPTNQVVGSRPAKALVGASVSMLQFGIQMLLQASLAPLILHYESAATLGTYAALNQVLMFAGLVDLGISQSAGRFLARATAFGKGSIGDVARMCRIMLAFTSLAYASGLVILSIVSASLLRIEGTLAVQVKVSCWVLAGWAVVRIPWLLTSAMLNAAQDLSYLNASYIAGNLMRLAASIVLVYRGAGILGLIAANVISEASVLVIQRVRCRIVFGDLQREEFAGNRVTFKEVISFGLRLQLMDLAKLLTQYTDQFVLLRLMGTLASARFYSTFVPVQAVWQVYYRIIANTTPALHEMAGGNDRASLRVNYLKLVRYSLLFTGLGAAGLILLNRDFVSLWLGPEQYAGDRVSYWLAALTVFLGVSHINSLFLMIDGVPEVTAGITFCEGIIKVALSIFLVRLFQIEGVVIGTVVAALVTYPVGLWCCITRLSIGWRDLVQIAIWPAGRTLLLLAAAMTCLNTQSRSHSLASSAMMGLALIGFWAVLSYAIGLTRSEREQVSGSLRARFA